MAKLRLQKYFAGIPAAFTKSSNMSFFIPVSRLVFMFVIMNDIVFGCTASTSSGIGRILLPLKYWAYCHCPFYSFKVPFWRVCRLGDWH